MTQLSQEEKINYIYSYIKTEKRNKIFKIIFKIVILFIMFFGFQYLINNIGQDKIRETITDQIWDITAPIVKDLVKDLDTGSVWWINKERIQQLLKENPSLLDNF